jgi:bifunctional non-homologous end joining protein LigD
MLWDRGTYEAEDGGGEESLRDGYERGDLKIVLHGERLQGGWVLVRIRRAEGGRRQWLLIKHRDEMATSKFDVVATVDTSVKSGRTMDEIATRRGRVWQSNRDGAGEEPAATRRKRPAAASPKKRAAPRRRRTTRSTS